ncbi:hypothetical protein [Sedimentitalea sp.]|uniref:hypothetical protein n=1 Tax=Sedimentitalea sp. TaxID=2048915 RepID=UPI003298D863
MSNERFRLRIEGSWSAKEMGQLFQSCETIYAHLAQFYGKELYREYRRQSNDPTPTGNADGRDKLLRVISISYSSPGWADLAGAGELTGHLKDFILGVVDRVIERKDRDQQRQLTATQIEAASLENYSKQLELIDRTFDLADRTDLSDSQRQSILTSILAASRPLGTAVAEGRLVSVEDLTERK